MWKVIALIGLAGAAAVLLGIGYVRLAPVDAETFHIAPEAAVRTGRPNDILIAEAGDRAPVLLAAPRDAVAAALAQVVASEPRVTVLAGAAADGLVTYIQRSALWGFPDAISISLEATTPETTTLRLYGRARYGHSDLGVNAARAERWLAALDAALAGN